MRRIICLAALWLCIVQTISAQGLRYSVCIVEPEFSETSKALMSDYSCTWRALECKARHVLWVPIRMKEHMDPALL